MANLTEASMVFFPLSEYERLKQAELQVKEFKAKVKELESPNQTKAIYDAVYRLMASLFESVQSEQSTVVTELQRRVEELELQNASMLRSLELEIEHRTAADARVKELEADAAKWQVIKQGLGRHDPTNGEYVLRLMREDAEQIRELEADRDDWQRRCREATSQIEGLYKRIKNLEVILDEERITNYHGDFSTEFRKRVECEAKIAELEAATAQFQVVLQSERDCLNSHLEAAHEARRKAEAALLAMRDDAELGRLVRALPAFYQLGRNHENAWIVTTNQGKGDYRFFDDFTPEDALRAAGVGTPATEGQETAAEGGSDWFPSEQAVRS